MTILENHLQAKKANFHQEDLHFVCCDCGEVKPIPHTVGGTGYAVVEREGRDLCCYACCALRDKKQMQEEGKITLYLSRESQEVTNWPGTLRIPCRTITRRTSTKRTLHVWILPKDSPDGNAWKGWKWVATDHDLITLRRL